MRSNHRSERIKKRERRTEQELDDLERSYRDQEVPDWEYRELIDRILREEAERKGGRNGR